LKYDGSWSTPVVYSVSGDDVIGSCFVKLIDERTGELEAEYQYDMSSKRDRCKGSETSPWESCE
jgi:hypothetical protein